jgi:nucleolar protein 14
LMSEYLMRCPILSGRDIAIGSFLCTMVLSVCLSCPSIHLYYKFISKCFAGAKPP